LKSTMMSTLVVSWVQDFHPLDLIAELEADPWFPPSQGA
jgi:hypothetical protein